MKKIFWLILLFTLLFTSSAVLADGEINITYKGFSAGIGWTDPAVGLGNQIGTTGQSRKLECVEFSTISLPEGMNLKARGHVSQEGWLDYITNNGQVGILGRDLELEAIEIDFNNDNAPVNYDIYYRAHVSNLGWLGWAKNGETAGTTGYALPIEAIQTIVLPAGSAPPGVTNNASYNKSDLNNVINVNFKAHVANTGWIEPAVNINNTIGTTGQSKQLECIEFDSVCLPEGMFIQAKGHVSNIGWQDFITNNGQIGTTGRGLGLEAIQILFGRNDGQAPAYDIYYRTHVRNIGWMSWAKNGGIAGTVGYGLPIEAVQVKVVPKDYPAVGEMTLPVYNKIADSNLNLEYILDIPGHEGFYGINGSTVGVPASPAFFDGITANIANPTILGTSLTYQVFCSNVGWCGWNHDGNISSGNGNSMEIVQFELHGGMEAYYDVYYQVSILHYGWLDWTKNGAYAGSSGGGLPIQAIRVVILPKFAKAPGLTERAYIEIPCNQYFTGRGIMVSIPLQMVFLKEANNAISFIADCTTGTPNTESATPVGNFLVIKKSQDTYLRGVDYYDHVNWWIPFIGTEYGFHDASWRQDNEFGRNVFLYDGSHGCINMRLREINVFANLIHAGDLVVIR